MTSKEQHGTRCGCLKPDPTWAHPEWMKQLGLPRLLWCAACLRPIRKREG